MRLIKKIDLTKLKKTFIVSSKLLALLWSIDKKIFIGNAVVFSIPAIIPFLNAYIYALIIDLLVESLSSGDSFDFYRLGTLILARFIVLIVQDLAQSLQTYYEQLLYYKFPAHLYQLILEKISGLDLQYFEDSTFQDRLEKVRDSYTWRPLNAITYSFYTFQSTLQTLIALVAIATLNWLFIFVVLILALPSFLIETKYANIQWGIWYGESPKRKRFNYIADLIQNGFSIKELKIFQISPRLLSELKSLYASFTKENINVGRKLLRTNVLLNLLATTIYIGIEIYIIFQAITRVITIGGISYYTQVITNFQQGLGGFFRNSTQLFTQSLYIQEIFGLLDTPALIEKSSKNIKIETTLPPVIEFRNITFAYPKSKEKIFNNFSLTINPGEKIAIVGENGAGKTTLIKLLARFYDVNEGEIMVNGHNIKDLELASWYRLLGVLFQDFVRYEYSLEDNIYFGRIWEEKNNEKIKNASKMSGASSVAESLKNGYLQMLGKTFDDGVELSVGQWQKVALARAFLRDAPILILDEPTAAIDAKAESEIFEKVDQLSKDKTVIIISHRFSTVRNADKIYVVEKGKIKEEGSHEELMKLNKQYATLFNLQAKGYK